MYLFSAGRVASDVLNVNLVLLQYVVTTIAGDR